MAKSDNSKSKLPPYVDSSANFQPSNDPNSYSLEKFRLYETRQVTKLNHSFISFDLKFVLGFWNLKIKLENGRIFEIFSI